MKPEKQNLKKIVLVNTVANYVLVVAKFATQIFITRLLFLGLGKVSYGFWALIWSIFGYSLLLDFGFGTSAKKVTAEVSVTHEYKLYNRQLSTIIFSYSVMSVFIIIATIILKSNLALIFKFPEGADIAYYQKVFLFFGILIAFAFPTGVFNEILIGLNKIYIRNIVRLITIFVNFLGIFLIFKFGYGLLMLAVYSVCVIFLSHLVLAMITLKLIPNLKISIKYFDFSLLKELVGFSFFAYIVMFANMIIYKTDQIIVGAMLGLSSVAIYQIGSRLAWILAQLSNQFQGNLSPIAASLYKDGQHERLREILINSNKFITFITTIFFIILTLLAKPILYIWLEVTDPEILTITYLMNISMYFLIIFRSGSANVLLMTGSHKFLAVVGTAESVINIGLSIVFILLFGVIGVAMGTLVPNVFLSVFIIFPAACRFSKIKIWQYFTNIFIPIAFNSIIPILLILFFISKISIESWKFFNLISVASLAGISYLITGYFIVMNHNDKRMFKETIMSFKSLRL